MSARRATPRLLAVLVLALLPVVAAAPAHAHARLVTSTPADGAVLTELPAQVGLRFSEAMMAPASVVVTAPDGSAAVRGTAEVRGSVVTQGLAPLGQQGTYTVAFRVFSEDGHPVTGRLLVSVGRVSDPAAPASADQVTAGAAAGREGEQAGGRAGEEGVVTRGVSAVRAMVWSHTGVGLGLLVLSGGLWWASRRRPA